MSPLRISYVTPELSPLAKVGGLADVSGALPDALAGLGHDVRVFFPLYSRIDRSRHSFEPMPELSGLQLTMGGHTFEYHVLRAEPSPQGAERLAIACDPLYGRPSLYTDDPDEHLRFLLLCRASLEICQRWKWSPQVVHCHDWQTAMVPVYLKSSYAWDRLFQDSRSLLTLHNLGYQGTFGAHVLDDLNLEGSRHHLAQADLEEGRVNFLKSGILHADLLSTVSPTYAQEIQTDEFSFGLGPLLRDRRHDLVGILNGVDLEHWNPRTDPLIPFRYSRKSAWRKAKNKEALLTGVGLTYDPDAPCLGIVTRLTSQKGLDLLEHPIEELLRRESVRVVVLGSGEPKYEKMFVAMEQRHPDKFCFYKGFSEELAHLVEAGSDLFLMPSLYEPCGLNQMYSQLYGTIPLVRRTGGLADSVTQIDPATGEGTGILFEHANEDAVRWALDRALRMFKEPELWKRIIQNAMAQDFSWARRAHEYEDLYARLVASAAA